MSLRPVNGTLDRWLSLAVVLTLLVMVGFIAWSSSRLGERQEELRDQQQESNQQLLGIRLDGLFLRMAEELREEAEFHVHEPLDANTERLERWLPLLRSEWSIRSIILADESGQGSTLERDGTSAVAETIRTVDGTLQGSKVLVDGTSGAALSAAAPTTVVDPRRQLWFTKALENPRHEPVWSLDAPDSTGGASLMVSYLVRRDLGGPYHIVAFAIDLSNSPWLDLRSSRLAETGAFVLDGNGRLFDLPGTPQDARVTEAVEKAASRWSTTRPGTPFEVVTGEQRYQVLIHPYLLNGETLYTGTLLDQELIVRSTSFERHILLGSAILLVMLVTLLSWVWMRRRREEKLIRRQEKVSRSREMKLAQVIGEREVLNREVHHRVKNNLQVVSSLLNLQAMRLNDGPVRDEFLRGKQRIDTLALVHHKLYALKDLRSVDLRPFIEGLVEALDVMYHREKSHVSHDVRTANVHTDQDTAIGLGLILCELVINAYRHAFPYVTGGHVEIQVQPVDGALHRMVVKDNGKGTDMANIQGPGRLGIEIVEALAEQLDGSFHMQVNGGTTCEVLFRLRPEHRSADAG